MSAGVWLLWPEGEPSAAVVERTRFMRWWRSFRLGSKTWPWRNVREAHITIAALNGLTPVQAAELWENWLRGINA